MIAATLLALQVVSSQPDANALNYEPKMLSADCAEWTESRKENGAKRVNDVAWAQSYVDRWKRAASPGFTLAKFVEVIDRAVNARLNLACGATSIQNFPASPPSAISSVC